MRETVAQLVQRSLFAFYGEEENSYFEEDAYQRSFLNLINNERARAGLAPVALGDSIHNAAAMDEL